MLHTAPGSYQENLRHLSANPVFVLVRFCFRGHRFCADGIFYGFTRTPMRKTPHPKKRPVIPRTPAQNSRNAHWNGAQYSLGVRTSTARTYAIILLPTPTPFGRQTPPNTTTRRRPASTLQTSYPRAAPLWTSVYAIERHPRDLEGEGVAEAPGHRGG